MQTFREYMEAALYDPERGFYNRRTATEDFYTAPELHPAFAGVLAREIGRRLDLLRDAGVPGPYSIVEMGAGSGLLAAQLLRRLREERREWAEGIRYTVVERCRDRMLDSVVMLSAEFENVLGYSRLEDMLPCAGVFVSNELVDAFPVHLLEKRGGAIFEVYVEGPTHASVGRMALGELSSPELETHGRAVADGLADGERHAVNLEALRWLRLVAEKLSLGTLVTIDYGQRFGGAPNPPRAFHRHAVDDRVSDDKGLKDITASVDFDALISEGQRLGLRLESYGTLARFLIERGVGDWLAEGSDAASFGARAKVKTLLHPEGMGEAYKVLIQAREAKA